MNILLITVSALLTTFVAWFLWRLWTNEGRHIPPEWVALIGRIANDQALGHHRDARRRVLKAVQGLDNQSGGSDVAYNVRISLAGLMAKDPIYPEVLQAIRTACTAEPAVSELALCVRLRQFLVEDIRQCEEIAESLGQIRRRELGAEALLIASFHQPA